MCDFKLTSEHSIQISLSQVSAISTDDCLWKAVNSVPPVSTLVYCPDENFCGLEFETEKTSEMAVGQNQTCEVYDKEAYSCDQTRTRMARSG